VVERSGRDCYQQVHLIVTQCRRERGR
jgi:hypothetical protein